MRAQSRITIPLVGRICLDDVTSEPGVDAVLFFFFSPPPPPLFFFFFFFFFKKKKY